MGRKYIIEIEEEPLVRKSALHGETSVWRASGFSSLVFDNNGLDKLTPYTEPDTESIRKRGYDKGLDDIGNALRLLLFQYSNYTLQTIFGYDTARAVVEHFEGSEIVARIRCYEGGVKQDVETIRNEAYQRGYDDAKHECQDCQKIMMDAEQERVDKAYQQGLNDAENRKATCEFCGYVNKGELDEPCKFCANNYLNMFRPRKDNKLIRKNIKDIMDSLDCTISDFEKAIEEIKNEAD